MTESAHVHGPNCDHDHHDHDHEHGQGHDLEESSYQDRFLQGSNRLIAYDLLVASNKVDETNDPDVTRYIEAKAEFQKGYDKCRLIPATLDDETLDTHRAEITEAAETMVRAWLIDDKAAPMSERVLILGQQYEKVLLKDVPEEKREGFFVKESLLFSAWILLIGKQYAHCITTLTLALETYADQLPARIYFLRATCHLNLGQLKDGLADLQKAVIRDPNFALPYSVMGSIQMSSSERFNASKNFRAYIEKGHPDTVEYSNALFALSVLTLGPGQKKTQESSELYQRGKEAEKRFEYLYGHTPNLNDIKRNAIVAHEPPEVSARVMAQWNAQMRLQQQQRAQAEKESRIERLIQSGILSSKLPSEKISTSCANCHAEKRKGDPDKALMICSACRSVWYCSRECQKAHYKSAHKRVCEEMRAINGVVVVGKENGKPKK
ncbi:hypothetical protein BC936DRAFT_141047 [Jimgerdemannia flammicorona]|uniref:MYND-type domain-containing protein n=1 Tax=Jimgerdemannia flammicorona TaxID=994334 RepID=A0A433DGC7_9FUNG|nr:hypothetical protein BC936DRAFT_141047 [Jimgerdemannia flammicorona]